ncbi:hypothetical protein AB0N62_37455 [Streptomyces sp. NPDC093982]|uniref:hypothetical protein n=1 Tax=Streptomyces sp. NPDC093982 TaxID=3155077 RepID=UPI0034412496
MTTTIMTRAVPRTTAALANPEYWCGPCDSFHTGPCTAAAHRQLGDLLARMVRKSDARTPAERRTRRTLQEMLPGYERQPVLILHRPAMADDACPLCLRWKCDPSNCPPAASAPAPATADSGMQCDVCGGVFGAAAPLSASMQTAAQLPTAWTYSACQNNGY